MYGYSDIYVTMYLKVTKQNAAFIAPASGCFSGSMTACLCCDGQYWCFCFFSAESRQRLVVCSLLLRVISNDKSLKLSSFYTSL